MRKLLLSILLASAVTTPALAARPDRSDSDREAARAERQAARAERQQSRAERSAPQRPQISGQGQISGAANTGQQTFARRQGFQQQNVVAGQGEVRAPGGERRAQLLEGRRQRLADESLRQSDRPVPNVLRTRTRTPVVSDVPRPGTQPRLRDGSARRDRTHWSTNWRSNHRYDWYNYRNRNRSLFHFGFYTDPFGWGYQPYSIGWRLWPNYYSSNYWINDPWQYRLPYAPPGYRWIRYYDDAILVDTWSGEVVDVIRNFFW